MDPVNGDVELAGDENGVDHADESPASGEEMAKSPSYWEEVDQEEVERERRYTESSHVIYPATRASRPLRGYNYGILICTKID